MALGGTKVMVNYYKVELHEYCSFSSAQYQYVKCISPKGEARTHSWRLLCPKGLARTYGQYLLGPKGEDRTHGQPLPSELTCFRVIK